MINPLRFFLYGYGASMLTGLIMVGWLGQTPLAGGLTAWIGGGLASMILALGWYRGLWMTGVGADTAPVLVHPDTSVEAHRAVVMSEFAQWDRDLASEAFEADGALEDAKRRDASRTGRTGTG